MLLSYQDAFENGGDALINPCKDSNNRTVWNNVFRDHDKTFGIARKDYNAYQEFIRKYDLF